jgi:phage regulator Rha-like protein
MSEYELKKFEESIREKIYSIRGFQVMLDRDLAELYGVETKRINEAVKRNKERFPREFCFVLNNNEMRNIRSQFATLYDLSSDSNSQEESYKDQRGKHKKYLPYVFTQEGVAMLSAVLRSEIAVKMSIKIMKAFIEMRKFIQSNAQMFQRLDRVELKQIETYARLNENDKKFDKIFSLMESGDLKPKQGIFFEGQIFDAYNFVSELFRGAEKSILIIDNYIDDSVLIHLTKVKTGVSVRILTRYVTDQFKLDVMKFAAQYFPVEVKVFPHSHDRFIIIDGRDVYHVGASLKDLGKKWVGFSKFGKTAIDILGRLDEID